MIIITNKIPDYILSQEAIVYRICYTSTSFGRFIGSHLICASNLYFPDIYMVCLVITCHWQLYCKWEPQKSLQKESWEDRLCWYKPTVSPMVNLVCTLYKCRLHRDHTIVWWSLTNKTLRFTFYQVLTIWLVFK